MTEREWILATDVRALDCALYALRHIVAENNPFIEPSDMDEVCRTLRMWREKSLNGATVRVLKEE